MSRRVPRWVWGHVHVVPRGRVHRATAEETRRMELTLLIKEALHTGDEDEKKKVEELTAEFELLIEWLEGNPWRQADIDVQGVDGH